MGWDYGLSSSADQQLNSVNSDSQFKEQTILLQDIDAMHRCKEQKWRGSEGDRRKKRQSRSEGGRQAVKGSVLGTIQRGDPAWITLVAVLS